MKPRDQYYIHKYPTTFPLYRRLSKDVPFKSVEGAGKLLKMTTVVRGGIK